ncbi:MAG: hypothetical protein E7632_09105 [Ruminococcaceae bacterium]|nr:hypothetical protein [Oscillospiraceae bacterium]
MKKTEKAISRFLLLALTVSLLAGCGETSTTNTDTTAPANTETTEPVDPNSPEGRKLVSDDLPEKDYGGAEFRILADDSYSATDFVAEEEIGAVVNDAIYQRNRTVEERFNVDVVTEVMLFNQVPGHLNTVIASNEDAYDLIAHHMILNAPLALEGFYLDLGDVAYFDETKPWWNKNAWENLSIGGHSYLMYGSITPYGLGSQYCVYMNKKIGEDYGLTDTIYDTALEGKFTIDYYSSLIKDTWRDLNGNSKQDEEDFYGLAAQVTSYATPFVYSFGETSVVKDSDGMPVLAMNTEKWASMVEKVYNLFYESNGTITTTGWTLHKETFIASRALFFNGVFQHSYNYFTDFEDDYAMIPYPKWDENQEEYYTMTDGSSPLVGIPVTVADSEFSGIITEALAAESWKQIIPKVYDIALKVRGARDEDSLTLIDMIANGCVFDMGFIYGNNQMMGGCLKDLMEKKKNNFMSHFDSNKSKWEERLEDIVESFTANE